MNVTSEDVIERTSPGRESTLVQVAKHAGVSVVTASLVLNNSRSNTRVSKATRERVLQSGQLLNYRPNALARSLRQKKTHVIAFHNAHNVSFSLSYPFYGAILSGVQAGCTEFQKDLLFHANFAGRSEDDVFSGLHNGQIDGLVLYLRTVTPLVQRLVDSQFPVVTLAEEVSGVPYVGIDNENGGRMLAQHVASQGYKRVLYRSIHEASVPSAQLLRKRSFSLEAATLGLTVVHTAHSQGNEITPEEQEIILASSQRPDAIVCWNDASADAVVSFCLKHGLQVPGDMAITGFDGLISNRRPSLLLTTICAPWAQAARTAVQLLVAHCNGEEVPSRTILPVELLVGDTT